MSCPSFNLKSVKQKLSKKRCCRLVLFWTRNIPSQHHVNNLLNIAGEGTVPARGPLWRKPSDRVCWGDWRRRWKRRPPPGWGSAQRLWRTCPEPAAKIKSFHSCSFHHLMAFIRTYLETTTQWQLTYSHSFAHLN